MTLGIEPKSPPLQIAMGIEAVLGFGILSAGFSWILSIYPIIEHRRSLSHQITLLHFGEDQGIRRLDEMNDSDIQTLFFSLSSQLTTIRIELSQFPITCYFQEADEKSALSSCLFYLAEIAHDFSQTRPGVRVASTLLGGSVDHLLALVEELISSSAIPTAGPLWKPLLLTTFGIRCGDLKGR